MQDHMTLETMTGSTGRGQGGRQRAHIQSHSKDNSEKPGNRYIKRKPTQTWVNIQTPQTPSSDENQTLDSRDVKQ